MRDDAPGQFSSQALRAGGRRSESGPFAFTELPGDWRAPHLQLIEYLAPANDPAETFEHANGARRLAAIWTVVEHSDDPVVKAFEAKPGGLGAWTFESREADGAALGAGTCLMFTPHATNDPPRSAALAVLVEIESLNSLPSPIRGRALARGPVAWLSPSEMHGVWLGFVERAAWATAACSRAAR